ncbi:MAG: tail fiber domain-containing protein [Bacteroidota bacterium]
MKIKQLISTIFLLFITAFSLTVKAQVTTPANTGISSNFVGWNSTELFDLNVEHKGSLYNMNFKTNALQRLQILANGNVAIGNFTPAFLLDVNGDIDINTTTGAYWLANGSGSDRILWHGGDIRNIFVGVNAGNPGVTSAGGFYNTLVGNEAGFSTTGGLYNTAIGYQALYNNNDAHQNVAIGSGALYSLVTGIGPPYDLPESENTAVGVNALHDNLAYGGCALGFNAGKENVHGCSLVAIGEEAAELSLDGNNNMAIGEAALKSNKYLSENIAIGKTALEMMNFNPTGTYSCLPDVHGRPTYGCVSSCNVAVGNGALRFTDPGSVNAGTGILDDGKNNTAIGDSAGYHNAAGYNNSFVGHTSGFVNVAGHNNTIVGVYSGLGSLLSSNTFLGCSTAVVTGLEFNSTAIGYQATVPFHDQMILGNDSVRVGIGLSGDLNVTAGVGPGPQNKLEINAGMYPSGSAPRGFDPPPINAIAYSGLRLRDMTNICTTEPNLGPGILSVNDHGDIIYVPKEGLGNYCGAHTTYPLAGDFEIPLNGHDYYFSGQHLGSTDVLVGTPCTLNPAPYAKFQSYQTTDQTSYSISMAGYFTNQTNDKIAVGAYADSKTSQNANYGLVGTVGKGKTNVGVLGSTNGITTPLLLGGNNVGTYGFTQSPSPGKINYAVVGDLGIIPCPVLPCPLSLTDFAGYFNGDVLSTTGNYQASDANLKENIQDINDPMTVLTALTPKSYTFKQQQNESMRLPAGTHYGVLAQDLEQVLPNAVKDCVHPARYDSLGNEMYPEIDFKAVNYSELIPFLVAAVKQQEQTIESMQAKLDNCCNAGNRQANPGGDEGNSNGIDVELKNIRQIVLNQNFPNPFAEHTMITFSIPSDVKEAQMFFYDNKGTILKTVDITERGEGQINVYAPDLSSGIYKYTLITDGKVFDTKQMVKQN